jgi:hypothetical protein
VFRLTSLVQAHKGGRGCLNNLASTVPPTALLGQGTFVVVLLCFLVSSVGSRPAVLKVSRSKRSLRSTEVGVSVLADHRCINKCIGYATYLCMET